MKFKHSVLYAVLAVAFVAVSLWVILSGGKSARAVRAKFRLGGLMLTISSMLTLPGCSVFQPTCYDTVKEEIVTFSGQTEVSVGGAIAFSVSDQTYSSYSYEIIDVQGNILQSGPVLLNKDLGMVVIGETTYRGPIAITIFGGDRVYLGSQQFILT